jgi:hypothetical protein
MCYTDNMGSLYSGKKNNPFRRFFLALANDIDYNV